MCCLLQSCSHRWGIWKEGVSIVSEKEGRSVRVCGGILQQSCRPHFSICWLERQNSFYHFTGYILMWSCVVGHRVEQRWPKDSNDPASFSESQSVQTTRRHFWSQPPFQFESSFGSSCRFCWGGSALVLNSMWFWLLLSSPLISGAFAADWLHFVPSSIPAILHSPCSQQQQQSRASHMASAFCPFSVLRKKPKTKQIIFKHQRSIFVKESSH